MSINTDQETRKLSRKIRDPLGEGAQILLKAFSSCPSVVRYGKYVLGSVGLSRDAVAGGMGDKRQSKAERKEEETAGKTENDCFRLTFQNVHQFGY